MEIRKLESPTDRLLRLVSECKPLCGLVDETAEGFRNASYAGGSWIDFHTPDVSASLLRDIRTTVRNLRIKLQYLETVLGIGAGDS